MVVASAEDDRNDNDKIGSLQIECGRLSALSKGLPNASREWYDARALFGAATEELEVMQEEQRVKTLVNAFNDEFPTDNQTTNCPIYLNAMPPLLGDG
jgi:hypothetical protein